MKKLSLVLVLALLLSTVCGFAEGIDFSSMSDEEISALYESTREELYNRQIVKSDELDPGYYIVGVDIAQGQYEVEGGNNQGLWFYLFDSLSLYEEFLELSKKISIDVNYRTIPLGDSAKIDLVDGQVVKIQYNTMVIKESRSTLAP